MSDRKGLVLTRKIGESIIIDGDIKITLVEIRSKKSIFIRVDAPDDITINRSEVQDQIDKEMSDGTR